LVGVGRERGERGERREKRRESDANGTGEMNRRNWLMNECGGERKADVNERGECW